MEDGDGKGAGAAESKESEEASSSSSSPGSGLGKLVVLPWEIRILDIACRQTARAAAKRMTARQLDSRTAAETSDMIREIRRRAALLDHTGAMSLSADEAAELGPEVVAMCERQAKVLGPPRLDLGAAIPAEPVRGFHGWDEVADLRSTDVFAGGEAATSADPFLDLTDGPKPGKDTMGRVLVGAEAQDDIDEMEAGEFVRQQRVAFDEFRRRLSTTQARCMQMITRSFGGSGAAALMQLRAYVEEIVFERMPMPRGPVILDGTDKAEEAAAATAGSKGKGMDEGRAGATESKQADMEDADADADAQGPRPPEVASDHDGGPLRAGVDPEAVPGDVVAAHASPEVARTARRDLHPRPDIFDCAAMTQTQQRTALRDVYQILQSYLCAYRGLQYDRAFASHANLISAAMQVMWERLARIEATDGALGITTVLNTGARMAGK